MKSNFASAALGILLVAGPARAVSNPVTEARFVNAMQRGKAAYERGDQANSEKEFAAALKLKPESLEARNNLGAAQYRAGRFPEAQQSFEKSGESTRSADRARSAYQAGNSLFRQKKLPEAAAAYKAALRWDEKDEDARFNLQVVLDQMKAQQKQQDKSDKSKDQAEKPKAGEGSDKADKGKDQGGQPKPGEGKDKADKSNDQAAQPKAGEDKDKADKGKGQAAQTKPGQGQPQSAQAKPGQKGPQDESERLLQYYQDKERQAKRSAGGTQPQARPGQESW